MKNILLIALILLVQPMCAQQLERWQKDFCINTLRGYTKVDDSLKIERLRLLSLLNKHWAAQKGVEQWFLNNIARTDSLINVCVELVENSECAKLAALLEKERWNLYAHPHKTVALCWDLHSVLSLMYSVTTEDDTQFYKKVVILAEYSKVHAEAVQASLKELHPLYRQIMEELLYMYDALGYNEKASEVAKVLADTYDYGL